jgi:hypothetical protein
MKKGQKGKNTFKGKYYTKRDIFMIETESETQDYLSCLFSKAT